SVECSFVEQLKVTKTAALLWLKICPTTTTLQANAGILIDQTNSPDSAIPSSSSKAGFWWISAAMPSAIATEASFNITASNIRGKTQKLQCFEGALYLWYNLF
uniref:Uncharacterized protein n=1 Tax=Romanomermis culicivorax TaxID=13658 RepID=A0A915IP17_ROMCU